jgi:transcriptional regulator with XRE-family HTH domain
MAVDTHRLEALIEARRQLPPPSVRRALRLEAGLALADVAEAVGCTRQAVANWESGTSQPRGRNVTSYVAVLSMLRRELGAP